MDFKVFSVPFPRCSQAWPGYLYKIHNQSNEEYPSHSNLSHSGCSSQTLKQEALLNFQVQVLQTRSKQCFLKCHGSKDFPFFQDTLLLVTLLLNIHCYMSITYVVLKLLKAKCHLSYWVCLLLFTCLPRILATFSWNTCIRKPH